jgi:GMP reductase
MKIDNVAQLDFDDVLLKPQRTTLRSRQDVLVERDFYFYHSPKKWNGVPVMCANMSFAGLNLAQKLAKHHIITCLHKYHSVEIIKAFLDRFDPMTTFYEEKLNYIWPSFGYSDEDLRKIEELKTYNLNLCIDVPNGHIDSFVDYCAKIRNICPNAIIMAGNVTDPASTQELIIHGGVDIVKTQIGPGSACTTRLMTGVGYGTLSCVIDNSHVAHGLKSGDRKLGLICSDGGCRYPGDVCKAFGGGADFVMLGGYWAGTSECEGILNDAMFELPSHKDISEFAVYLAYAKDKLDRSTIIKLIAA